MDCVRIKGARGDQFFINRESVEHYAEELRQIEAVATIGAAAGHDAPQHVIARNSGPERDTLVAAPVAELPREKPEPPAASEIKRLKDENLNLRIDNHAKEIAIARLSQRVEDDRDKFLNAMQDMSYKLGAAETRLAQLGPPKQGNEAQRQSATDRNTEAVETINVTPQPETTPQPAQAAPEPAAEKKRSWFRW